MNSPSARLERPAPLLTTILASVSRSFYLTIHVLPKAVRQPIGLAYLLARASDTIADSSALPATERLSALREFEKAIRQLDSRPLRPVLPALIAATPNPAEQRLLGRIDDLFTLLGEADPRDRHAIEHVLSIILSGQILDVERFGGGPAALQTAAELEDYTYKVAGCVGEFWTRVCFHHIPAYSLLSPAMLEGWGVSYGKGLQLVNILRDFPEDLQQGRCYLPASSPAWLEEHPEGRKALYDRWLRRASEEMDGGRRYLEAIRPWRVRLACYLPWAIGVQTLRRLEKKPAYEASERIKVSRREVRAIFLRGLVVALCGNRFLGK